MKQILASFHARSDNDQDTLWSKSFDATYEVLLMTPDALRALRDGDRASERLGRLFFDHPGLCQVEIEHAITAYFSVDRLDQILDCRVAEKRADYRKHHRIIGTFEAEYETPGVVGGTIDFLWDEAFDATAYILNMPFEALVEVSDSHDSSDTIGLAHVHHDGPHTVYIEDAMCSFFGVDDLNEVTPAAVEAKRIEHAAELAAPQICETRLTIDVLHPCDEEVDPGAIQRAVMTALDRSVPAVSRSTQRLVDRVSLRERLSVSGYYPSQAGVADIDDAA